MIRGKGLRDEQLPPDAGEALVGYLRDGRPAGGVSRWMFLLSRVTVPPGASRCYSAISRRPGSSPCRSPGSEVTTG